VAPPRGLSAEPRELDDDEVTVVAARDPLTAQSVSLRVPETAVIALGTAVAVHQRLGQEIDDWCVTGPPADTEALFRALLARGTHESGSLPWAAVESLARDVAVDEVSRWDFRWTDEAPPPVSPKVPGPAPAWLDPTERAEVQRLLDAAFPTAALQVADPEVRRWAGVRDAEGALVACAADASTAPTLGFITSIGCAEKARGQGYGAAVTAFATAELVRERGRAGLWAYHSNRGAARVYDWLGYRDDHWMAWFTVPI